MKVESVLEKYKIVFENYLKNKLNELPKTELAEAICYSINNGGKRLRPSLMLITADLLGVKQEKVLPFSYSLELIHSSSLVHDDLPAIDNDDLRRGMPSCHKKFGEAEAILCGDAMLNLAYEVASGCANDILDIKCLKVLSNLSGLNGMLGGQYLDVTCEKRNIGDKDILSLIQKNKTGALLVAPFKIASILSGEKYLQQLTDFGLNLGIAFQIVDDILDVEGLEQFLGKTIGKDSSSGKLTTVSIYGLDKAKELADYYTNKALNSISCIVELELLKDLALHLLKRIK